MDTPKATSIIVVTIINFSIYYYSLQTHYYLHNLQTCFKKKRIKKKNK